MSRKFLDSAVIVVSLVLVGAVEFVQAQAEIPAARRVLCVTQSVGFEHDVIRRDPATPDQLSFAEKTLTEFCRRAELTVVCTKDATELTPQYLKGFGTVFFYTTGDLPIPNPQDLLDYVSAGHGFVGCHCATDTFHGWEQEGSKPFLEMVGAEFETHGDQEVATVRVVAPDFRACRHFAQPTFKLLEEWYLFQNLSPDIQVDLVLETTSMEQEQYRAVESYPIAWHRHYGRGRVFYTALGHREDVWTNPLFQQHVLSGIQWTLSSESTSSNGDDSSPR